MYGCLYFSVTYLFGELTWGGQALIVKTPTHRPLHHQLSVNDHSPHQDGDNVIVYVT